MPEKASDYYSAYALFRTGVTSQKLVFLPSIGAVGGHSRAVWGVLSRARLRLPAFRLRRRPAVATVVFTAARTGRAQAGDRMSRPGEIGLADAVAAIREELLAAAESGNGQELQFSVGPVDLEFTVVLRTDATVKSGFRAWVLSADAEAGLGRERTQRIALTLTPAMPMDGTSPCAAAGTGPRAPAPAEPAWRAPVWSEWSASTARARAVS